jgi:UDP-2,3-diacylglucosamine hydrolase
MRTLFIADLHLSEKHPQISQAFFKFLEHETENVDALYILGDLFEVWIGDDEHTPLMDEVALKLSEYAAKNNIALYYLHGNRDFMIGKKYAKQSAMKLLPEHCEINLYGQKILILHGDTLCLADKNYQKMRKVIHNPALQYVFNLLPLFLRKKIGWKIRNASQSKKVYKDQAVMDVTEDEVLRLMEKHRVQTLIHGHTHRVACHDMLIKGQPAQRYDVGDWRNNLSYVEVQQHKINLVIRPINFYN